MARVLVHRSLDRPEDIESTCDQERVWSDCANVNFVMRCSLVSLFLYRAKKNIVVYIKLRYWFIQNRCFAIEN